MNKTSEGVVKYFEGESLWYESYRIALIEKYNQFSDGAGFFCPKPRSTIMIFKCGPKNKLTNVYEFLPCVYKFSVDVLCPEVGF